MQWWGNLALCACWYGLKQRWIILSFLHYKTLYVIFQALIKSLVALLHNWKSGMALLESLEVHQCELMFLTTEWRQVNWLPWLFCWIMTGYLDFFFFLNCSCLQFTISKNFLATVNEKKNSSRVGQDLEHNSANLIMQVAYK